MSERTIRVTGKVLYALSHSHVKPKFRILYTVKDVEASKNELLARAVADSKTKAEVLTKAAGVSLGEIQSIDYSWEEVNFSVSPIDKMVVAGAPSEETFDMDIEPDDIDVTDTVMVVWKIY
ncbi:MAG: SIMPL domain-containing protein [Lachnospiraceae bacterium]|nr:SIMPL domain-containing protein [Lachnospiraceae bacterium]